MNRLGVIGAGVMGIGVATTAAIHGFQVDVVEIADDQLGSAEKRARDLLRRCKLFGLQLSNTDHILQRIHWTSNVQTLTNSTFIVENITEQWPLKKELYKTISRVVPDSVPIAANTSCIPIARFASVTTAPERVLGIHFMNPVPVKPTVEVIRGDVTSQSTVNAAICFLNAIGKKGIVVGDGPGFVINRVFMVTINEAIKVCQEGRASPKDIDDLFVQCLGHKMGPLASADLIGLDTIAYSLEVLMKEENSEGCKPAPFLMNLIDKGNLGVKSGRGFFNYEG